ncbi:MAG: hypothetical protein KAJ18_11695 [Candidatus Omnitrophica bacterium]|nr:hypothetical protein [Candidatus Omnitrophota bacterium]
MAGKIKSFSFLTGGGADTLDAFPYLGDAGPPVQEALTSDEFAFGLYNGLFHPYRYDTTLVKAATESPYFIVPVDNATGIGAWVLQGCANAPRWVDRGDPADWDFDIGDLTTDNAYHDLDLSSIVSPYSTRVKLRVRIEDDVIDSRFSLRKNGNTNDYNKVQIDTLVTNLDTEQTIDIACDSNQVIEYKASNLTWSSINILVVGWYVDIP